MSGNPLQLIVGLGNPGPRHESNRHNAGVMFLRKLCRAGGGELRPERKFFGETATVAVGGHNVRLLFPHTWMNLSGKAVAALCNFYRIAPAGVLVAYDEIDFEPGVIRFREGGGHGGHNGIRDIIKAFGGNRGFHRLRIGVGHPGHKSMVSAWVLSNPSATEAKVIATAIDNAVSVMPDAVQGDWERAMRRLHTEPAHTRAAPASANGKQAGPACP